MALSAIGNTDPIEPQAFIKDPIGIIPEGYLDEIHQLTLDILSEKGVLVQLDKARDLLVGHGARTDGSIVYLDEPVIQRLMDSVPRRFSMVGRQNGTAPLVFGDGQTRPVVCPGNGTMSIIEMDGTKRPSLTRDLDNLIRLCESSPLVDMAGAIPTEPGDMPGKKRHLHVLCHLLRHSHKPLIGMATSFEQTRESFALLEMVYGGDYLKDHHVIAYSVNPTSPLSFDPLTCETLMAYAAGNQVVFILPAPMAGLTGPLDMYGMLALMNAENLAGICLAQATAPGAPTVYSCGCMTADMRWANTITAAPEGSLIGMAAMQMARYYGLPSRSMAGMSEAKQVDFQAGMETMQNFLSYNMAGVHVVNQCLGVMDALMSTSYEKWILDEELVGRVMLMNRGLGEFDRQTVLETIKHVAHKGTFLMEKSVFENCHRVWRPAVSFWDPYDYWAQKNQTLLERANEMFQNRIASNESPVIDPGLDRDLASKVLQWS